MTAHSHDPAAHANGPRPGPVAGRRTAPTATRPWWLLPGLAAGIIVGALVVLGALPFSTVVYAGLIGGMLLMHLGGHSGHGGHGGRGGHGGHDAHGAGTAPEGRDLSTDSSDTQLRQSGSADELDDRALTDRNRNENDDHDKRASHGCH